MSGDTQDTTTDKCHAHVRGPRRAPKPGHRPTGHARARPAARGGGCNLFLYDLFHLAYIAPTPDTHCSLHVKNTCLKRRTREGKYCATTRLGLGLQQEQGGTSRVWESTAGHVAVWISRNVEERHGTATRHAPTRANALPAHPQHTHSTPTPLANPTAGILSALVSRLEGEFAAANW